MDKTADLLLCSQRFRAVDYPEALRAWGPQTVLITFYAFGAVTIQVTMDSVPANGDAFKDIGSRTKEVFSIRNGAQSATDSPAAWMQSLLNEAARSLSAALLDSGAPVKLLARTPLKWIHPILIASTSDKPKATARQLSSTFCSSLVTFRGGVLASGIGHSAISCTDALKNDVTVVLETVDAHWALYASYLQLDQDLYESLSPGTQDLDLTDDLEDESSKRFAEYFQAATIRTTVDTYLASQGGDIQAVWDCIGTTQSTTALVAGVERKLKLIQDLSERRSQQALTKVSSTLNASLLWLTFISALAAIAVLVTFFLDDLTSKGGSTLIRSLCFAGLLVIAFLSFHAWSKRFRRRQQSRSRQGGRSTST